MDTLLLDRTTWDLCLDANGNIAKSTNPYAIAQSVASACKLFAGELYYDTTKGVPYFGQVLGERPNLQFVKNKIEAVALTVPEVVEAKCTFASFKNRILTGTVRTIDKYGQEQNVSF